MAEARLQALAAYPGSCVLLAIDGDMPVATVTLIIVPNMTRQGAPYAFIENVVTHADHRGRGHAKALLAVAERRAWEAGCYRIMIVSGNHNEAAHETYHAAGYAGTKTGFQKRKIPDRTPSAQRSD
ncbi:GNAT family N-acetyltransferase [Gymnodinialimonas sp. 2305UL16-5]|uniref:GNAT family N-acetyltransferase n=1 Tax=Gymnodinialimonas mytili TaxID=3126503 RepID=UPI0030A9221E